MSDKKPAALPRVIIEQQPDGSLVVESYIAGSRHRETLTFGFEAYEIKQALERQGRQIKEYAKKERERVEAAAKARHGQVWRYVAENHGIGFANRTVNGVSSLKRNAKVDQKDSKKSTDLKAALDLI